ncbi:Na(+)-translocating NADH-quinone reductase subunit A [Shinella sp. S4-D37]|uniref:Na(+)-translocating NADH-quinone reductase subunit A n=1 Tax=Shinella sp. S4-D37 TaxID=3161999 RepID=UPI00346557E9
MDFVASRPMNQKAGVTIETQITDQCALFAQLEDDFRVEVVVARGDRVPQGAPVLRSRKHPELTLVAPVSGEVAAIDLGPGRRLSRMLFFHASDAGRHKHDVTAASGGDDAAATRALLLAAGLWPSFRSRPFGRIPAPGETPSAIFVMALDTRPDAPPPRLALDGREEELAVGLRSLAGLTAGPIVFCQDRGPDIGGTAGLGARYRIRKVAPVHPHGLAGFQLAACHPVEPGRIVWDIHAEDVAAIGALLLTGLVAETRLVSVAGTALREQRLVRCQPGADLRALSYDIIRPGPHRLLSGSMLDGTESRWLGRWHRQVTGIAEASRDNRPHWFSAALRGARRPLPIIPTAALEQAFGGVLPAAALVRAIASNDVETATRLGALSLTEEDVALADYVTGAAPRLSAMLRGMLDRIAAEEAA